MAPDTKGDVVIYLVGTADTKSAELIYLRDLMRGQGAQVTCVDVGTRAPQCDMDIRAQQVAGHHPGGAQAVLGGEDRGTAVAAMRQAFTQFCAARGGDMGAVIGIGGGGGTSIITAGLQALPYGVPKLMVSTLASGDTAPYVGISDIIMMPAVTDLAGLNPISRHILHNAAQAILGMAAHIYDKPRSDKRSVGLTMFGVTTPSVTQIAEVLQDDLECVIFHATGTGGRTMESLLSQGLLHGVLDITTTEIADEIVGGVLSAGPARLDAVIASGAPYVGSVGALDMVNFWAPDTVPPQFKDRLFYHHNTNVTLMRTTPVECRRIGAWIATKLNDAPGPVHLLLPTGGISALDIEGGVFWNPDATEALFGAIEQTLIQTSTHTVRRVPHHINDPAFAALAAQTYRDLT